MGSALSVVLTILERKAGNMSDERSGWFWRSLITLGAGVAGLWVRLPDAMHIMLYVMAADILTGLCRAGMAGELNSNCSFKGMMKKAAMVIITGLGVVLDQDMKPNLQIGSILALAFTAVEGFSIIENAEAMGLPLPQAFKDVFSNMRKTAYRKGK